MADPVTSQIANDLSVWIGSGLGIGGFGGAAGIYFGVKSIKEKLDHIGGKLDQVIEVMQETNTKLTLLLDRYDRRDH